MPMCSDISSGWYGHLNRVFLAVIHKGNRLISLLNAIDSHASSPISVAAFAVP